MATNPPSGDSHRNGMVRQRSQVLNPKTGIWTKHGPNGQFMDGEVMPPGKAITNNMQKRATQ